MKKNNALIIFIKTPQSGAVKTGLQPEMDFQQSLLLYKAIVEDLLDQFQDVKYCDVKLFFDPPHTKQHVKTWLGDQFEYLPQPDGEVGEKLHSTFVEMFAQKYEKVVLVVNDVPLLDQTTIIRAFSGLEGNDVVLGPNSDGGYYLIGAKKPHIELFDGINWSTNTVLSQTILKAKLLELELSQLEMKFNIATYADVVHLWNYLSKRHLTDKFFRQAKTFLLLKKMFEEDQMTTDKKIAEVKWEPFGVS